MAQYQAPVRDIKFVMKELIGLETLRALPGYGDLADADVDMILEEGAKFCEQVLFPLNQSGDEEGCRWENGNVYTPKGFKEAYQAFVDGGWASLACDPEFGGQGLPELLSLAVEEMICSSNLAFGLYPGLTRGAYMLLLAHGSDELKATYLQKLSEGRWGGTMCLTEPHCGTDLGMLRTKAVPQADGSYQVSGTKIFISSGEHDLTDNIIHFVIARTPDAPPGIRGISLFLVPKFLVNKDGTLGARNGSNCASIEHKMGIKASSTCVMTFDNATGYLVGDMFKGVSNMFTMMNNERLAVGNQGLGVGEVAYQNALNYARERLQGRSLTGPKYPDQAADPIIVHPDVRRMLLTMKAYNEGNRMLAGWVALQLDIAHKSTDPQQAQDADEFIQLLTPVVKAFLTDCGTECANIGVQVFGGHGYVRDYGMEQYVRDARIAQIYEGTNGIQALDLVGRKMPTSMGRYLRHFFHPIQQYIDERQKNPELQEFIGPLAKAFGRLQIATTTIAQKGLSNPDEAGAAATDYLRFFGLVSSAYLWTRAVEVALPHVGGAEDTFYQGKVETARFFMQKLLPHTSCLFSAIMSGSRSLMTLKDESFGPF